MSSLSSSKSTTILLPAAGWGSRMGYPNAKEILTNPGTNQPYIQYAIESAQELKAAIKIITRADKTDLVNWVKLYKQKNSNLDIDCIFVSETKEWPQTLLHSKPFWSEKNLVMLPDTDWKPKSISKTVLQKLGESDAVYGVFSSNKLNWGFVRPGINEVEIIEKPSQSLSGFQPWGMIAFSKDRGETLLNAHLESTWDHRIKKNNPNHYSDDRVR